MADGIMDFFSKEAGQARTKARDEFIDGILGAARRAADYYLGPTGIPDRASSAGRVAAEMNPVVGIMDAMQASGEGRYGDAALETAMALAPAYGVTKAARPVSEAVQEVLLGGSAAAGDAGRAFVERMNQRGPMPTVYSNPLMRAKDGPTFEEAPMIVQHNITPEGLRISEKAGGIPMPSIAISGAKHPLENFGDITLMLDPQKIAPSRDVPVWPTDAYTGRQPKAEMEFANEDAARSAFRDDPNFGHMGSSWMNSVDTFADADNMVRTAQYGIANKIADPKEYDDFYQYVRDVRRKSGGYIYEDELAPYSGMYSYGDVQPMLYPKDLFTPSGNRRKPKPYTAEDAWRRMNADKAYEAGAEQHYGAGLMRAVLSDKFKNLDEIKASRGLLHPPGDEIADVKGTFDNVTYDAINDIAEKFFDGRHRTAEKFMTDLAMGRSTSWANPSKEAVSAARKSLSEMKAMVKDMPTEYFEAKPRSVAQIGDFDAAIVPSGNTGIIDLLKRAGISDIREYDDQVKGMTRADVIAKMRDLMFSGALPATGLMGYSMLQDEQQ